MMKIRGIYGVEKKIVRTLYKEEMPLSVSEMSQKLGLPERLIKKCALELRRKGVIDVKSMEINPIQTDFNNLIRLYELYENIPQKEQESFLNCLGPKIRQEIEVALQTVI